MNTIWNNLILRGEQVFAGIKYIPSIKLSVLRKVFSLMGRRERIVFSILCVLALTSFLYSANRVYSNFTVVKPASGGSYREGIIGQPRFVNPLLASTDTDESIVRLVYSGLYKYDNNGNIVPDLAEGMPEITDEGRQWTIKIKRNAKWHNDFPLNAEDVLFTINTLKNQEFNSPRRNEWQTTTVEKTDDYTVVFKLRGASSPFFHNLTLPLISKHVWENISPADFVLADSNIEAIGSGPYSVSEVRKLSGGAIQSITLNSFNSYYNGRPHIDTIKLNFYEDIESVLNAIHGKQIDGFGFSPFEQNVRLDESTNEFKVSHLPLPQYQAVFFNTANKIFGDVRVRKALSTGTDVKTIIETVYNGQGIAIDSPILSQQVGNIPTATSEANLEEAKRLLDEAGWKVDSATGIRKKGANELAFTLATNNFSLNAETAEILAKQWQALGVKVTLNILPTKELTDNLIRPRNYDALLFAQKLGADPDPFIFWHSSQVKNPGLNLSGYANTTADRLISEARAALNKEERDAKYLELHNLFQADMPAIFLVQNVYSYAQDDEIQGLSLQTLPDSTLRFSDATNWYLNTKRVLK